MMFCLFLFISMRGRGYGNRFNDYCKYCTQAILQLRVVYTTVDCGA